MIDALAYLAFSNEGAEAYGLSTARIYAEMAKPLAQQALRVEYVPVRDEGPSPLVAWQLVSRAAR